MTVEEKLHSLGLAVKYEVALLLQRVYGLAHQVERAYGVLEPRVLRRRVHHRRKS